MASKGYERIFAVVMYAAAIHYHAILAQAINRFSDTAAVSTDGSDV